MEIPPHRFWRTTLAEWAGLVLGFEQKLKMQRRDRAWAVALLMNATGNFKDPVTPAQLLGQKEPRVRATKEAKPMPVDEFHKLLLAEKEGERGQPE